MNFEAFKNELVKQLLKRKKDLDGEITLHEVMKNRSALNGITYRPEGFDAGITVYAEEYYEAYKSGRTLDQIANGIISKFNDPEVRANIPVGLENILNEKNIVPALIPRTGNERMLQEMPHVPMEDLEVIFKLNVPEYGMATIDNRHVKQLGLNEKELMDIATNNPEYTDNITIKGMSEIILEIQPDKADVLPLEKEEMVVISNKSNFYGAAGVLNADTIKKIADIFGEDVFILPSSIHECIAIRKSDRSVEELKDIVCDINEEMVAPEDYLSNQVYQIDAITKKLSIAQDRPALEIADSYQRPQNLCSKSR